MYRFFGETDAYSLFNTLARVLTIVASLFYFNIKKDSISLYSRTVINFIEQKKLKIGKIKVEKIVEIILVSVELLLMGYLPSLVAKVNQPFGRLVGTGGNYFGLLTVVWLVVILISVLILSNPIKQLDLVAIFLPFRMIFTRLACFFNGCCWGVPWEYGPYNYHYDHPGNQVPVQAIEAGFVLIIFLFLLWHRKRARPGTMFPMYLFLYSGLRFFNEFFTAADPDIIGPFNMYHILCAIGFVVGLVAFFVMRKYGEKISSAFDRTVNNKIDEITRKKKQKIVEENERAEAEMKERLEKAKAARAKASVKYRKK
ncbi:MAG: prolipoprotein diacylglyceryl transferase [Clostridia bacterium]|nr:prolipoprotein diacylglyceryl transferase [Clostridia bacterium]